MPSATQAVSAAWRMKYSNYSGLPHMVTGLRHRLATRKERAGRERRCLELGLLHFIVAGRARVKQKKLVSCRGHRKYMKTHERKESAYLTSEKEGGGGEERG